MTNKHEKIIGLTEFLREQDIVSLLQLNVILFLGLSAVAITGYWLVHDSGWAHFALNSIMLISGSLLLFFLLNKKKVSLAAYSSLIIYGIIVIYSAWNGAGVKGTTYSLFILLVLGAGLFIGRRAGYITATLGTLVGLILLLAGRAGLLVNINRLPLDFISWLTLVVSFFIAAHLVGLVIKQVERSFTQYQHELDERIHAETALRILNNELEERVADRTAQQTLNEQSYKRRADEMSLLYRLGVSLAAGRDLFTTLNALQMEISQLIRHDTFLVAIYDEENGSVSFPIVFRNGKPTSEASRNLKEKPGVTGPVIFGGKTLYIPEILKDDVISTYHPISLDDMHTYLGTPLVSNERVIGMISVQSADIDAYTPEQIRLLENIAVHAALAIDKARLLDQFQFELAERKRTEEALSFSEQKFYKAFHITPVLMSIEDSQNCFIDINKAFIEKIGYQREEVIGRQASDLKMWSDPDDMRKFRQTMQEKGFIKDLEIHFRNKSGATGIVSISSEKFDVNNEVYSLTSAVDITERKQIEASLRYRESILGAITSAAELFIKSPDWRFEITAVLERLGKTINASHAYLFENHLMPSGEEVTSIMFEWAAPYIRSDLNDVAFKNIPLKEKDMDRWYETLVQGRPFIGDKTMADASEKEFLHTRGIKALLDMPIIVNGQWWGVMGFDDMLNEREWSGMEVDVLTIAASVLGAAIERQIANAAMDEELIHRKKLIEELETKNSELERFTYTVSHDLRSPLVTIKGFLGYLERNARNGNMEGFQSDMNRISIAADKMDILLKDLLELSRIGRIINTPEKLSFEPLVQDAVEIVHGRLEKHNVTLQIHPNLPAVYGDRSRLIEVLQNLIDNAAKYMGSQHDPVIEVGTRGQDESGAFIFFVRDNGMGIDPIYHDRIFRLFDKLDVNTEGAGVGLALVKRIVEVHGGRIWVESEAGKGSTFYFTLEGK